MVTFFFFITKGDIFQHLHLSYGLMIQSHELQSDTRYDVKSAPFVSHTSHGKEMMEDSVNADEHFSCSVTGFQFLWKPVACLSFKHCLFKTVMLDCLSL